MKGRPPIKDGPDCGRGQHLWVIALQRGEKVTCRDCGKKRRTRKAPA